jgi:hypothetical protein
VRVNSQDYWNFRFGSGDWSAKAGFSQTTAFAKSQVHRFGLDTDFDGTLCDFGCGAGDSIPIYHASFPQAKLVGVDFSKEAIVLCKSRFDALATFQCGGIDVVPLSDVIVCSNVLEHLDDDVATASALLDKCKKLLVIVPYREQPLSEEHVRAYDRRSFGSLRPVRTEVFDSPGWSQYGMQLYTRVYGLNPIRVLIGRPWQRRRMQILYEFSGRQR